MATLGRAGRRPRVGTIDTMRQGRGSGDRGRPLAGALLGAWLVCVVGPVTASVVLNRSFHGLPLVGVAIWFVILRAVRWFAPAARFDRLMHRGATGRAVALAEAELAVRGRSVWSGSGRVAWLNRRTSALLAAGRLSYALASALEAASARPDPETLAQCALALLWLNRYDEAAGAARVTLSLTRERSVSANATLANVLLARREPAEARAAAEAGLSDVEALLPLVQPEHHAALLAALARAERDLGRQPRARAHLRTLNRLARSDRLIRAEALAEEADALAGGDAAARLRALMLIDEAAHVAPHYVCWYASQPDAWYEVRTDPRFAVVLERAQIAWTRAAGHPASPPEQGAPPATFVAMELAAARDRGYARPAPRIDVGALAAQLITLGGTLALLVWWTWRFFLATS